jgi:hypothetical protein
MARFKRNYLPSQSRPWAKQLEDAIDSTERSFKTLDVNNRSKDEQFSASLNRLDGAVIDARSASELADAAQNAAIAANTLATTANGNAIAANSLATTANTTANTANSTAIAANTAASTANSTAIAANTAANAANATVIGFSSSGGSTINADNISGGSITGISLTSIGNLEVPFGTIFGYDINASNTLRTDGSIQRTQLNGGGTTGASVTSGGYFVRTSSSARYKTDIELLDIDLNDLYAAQPKTFKRIEEVFEDPEGARTYPGFIAEDLAGTSLDQFVFYSEDEEGNSRPEGIHYPELTGALLIAIKDLNARIEALESN